MHISLENEGHMYVHILSGALCIMKAMKLLNVSTNNQIDGHIKYSKNLSKKCQLLHKIHIKLLWYLSVPHICVKSHVTQDIHHKHVYCIKVKVSPVIK